MRGVDFGDLLEGALFIEAIGDRDGFGVVGQGDVFVAAVFCGGGHFFDGVAAVGGDGVHVQVAADIFEFD